MGSVEQMRKRVATVLAIGTSTPLNCVSQADYPDYYFRITNCEHLAHLKQRFKRICEKSMIKKRHMHLTEEILKANPNLCKYGAPSFNTRQDINALAIPQLGMEAATKAIEEWDQPKSKITHLIFCSTSGLDMPGPDYHLAKLLDLDPSVKRSMLYHLGCYGGGTVLRLAKELAENNKGARVLAVCSETSVNSFHGPASDQFESNFVGQALFGDGAGAVIVGADPDIEVERPLYQLVSAGQTILPDSEGAVTGRLHEFGLIFHLSKQIPKLASNNIEKCLSKAFAPIGINDWNSIFYIMHPGGPAILDQVEAELGLEKEKLRASRHVLSEYGNKFGASVLFVLDEMRKKSIREGKVTTGEGLEWGLLLGFGPGLTVESVVLRSMPIQPTTTHSYAHQE